jgi:hypothetical protein
MVEDGLHILPPSSLRRIFRVVRWHMVWFNPKSEIQRQTDGAVL